MSETKDPRRNRRKASRTAGPPVENATETATERLDTGDVLPISSDEEVAGEDTTEKIHVATGDSTVSAENAVPETATDATVRLGKAGAGSADSGSGEVGDTTTTAAAPETGEAAGGSWKRVLALAAAAVLVIGMVGAAVVSMVAVQSTQQRDERRSEYVATARQTVLNLTTIRADTAEEDIDRILTMASGEFKTEFDGRIDPFTEIVKQANVVSTGEVVEAAVERDDEKSGVILVAAKQTLTNAGAEGEQQRFYRFRVTVTRADDGNLTASDVEFVA